MYTAKFLGTGGYTKMKQPFFTTTVLAVITLSLSIGALAQEPRTLSIVAFLQNHALFECLAPLGSCISTETSS
jgi:hypothetical protein